MTALDELAADRDKNGRTSVWEAFAYASQQVRRWYEQRGQLATERALIDDNGDGVGKRAISTAPTARWPARSTSIRIRPWPARTPCWRAC